MSDTQTTEESLTECFEKATEAGSIAANQRVEELSKRNVSEGKMLDACGGSILTLHVDGRSKTGRLLANLATSKYRVSKAYGGGYSVHLPYEITLIPPVNGQEQSIYYAADSAAAKVIKSVLGIDAHASSYDS